MTLFLILVATINTYAAADFGLAGVLPKGRYQAVVRVGQAAEIQEKYNSGGVLQNPSRMNIRFSNEFLMKQDAFKMMANIVDKNALPNEKPMSKLDMGSAQFSGKAYVDYIVPQLARGVTTKWTLGFTVPVVAYKSNIDVYNVGHSNAAETIGQFAGKISEASPTLGAVADKAIKEGARGLVAQETAAKGYKSISERDEQFVADIIVGSSYKILEQKVWSLYLLNYLTLPTGPKDNPDDLLDLNIFGKTALQTVLYNNLAATSKLDFGIGIYHTWGITDDIIKRVPTGEQDLQPAESTKENLKKNPGDSIGLQLHSFYKLSDYFQMGAGYEYNYKDSDKYSGNLGQRYDLLEKHTQSEGHYAKFKLSYSTVDSFISGKSKIPYSVTYAYSDLVRGKNIERELSNEILLKFYF